MIRAFAYYARTTTRNRVTMLYYKLADPTRLSGTFLALAFAVSLAAGLYNAGRAFSVDLHLALAVLVFLQIAAVWIGMPLRLGPTRQQLGLFYRDAEIERLFQTPLGRVPLRLFKLAQTQWIVAVTAIAYAFLSSGAPDVSLVRLFLGWALVVEIVMLHSHLTGALGGYLARHRRNWLRWLLAAVAVAVIVFLAWSAVREDLADEQRSLFHVPSFEMLLLPVELLLAPAYSTSWVGFFESLWIPLLVFAIHALLFVTLDPTAEIRVAELQGAQQIRGATIWRLARTGPRWRAVVWKNLIAKTRGQPALARYAMLFVVLFGIAAVIAPHEYQVLMQFSLGTIFVVFTAYAVLVAPSTHTPGLQLDIPSADVLRAMPISAREIVSGAIVGPFLTLYGAVLAMFAIWAAAYTGTVADPVSATDKRDVAVLLLPFMLSLIFTQITIRNLLLLYFPEMAGPVSQDSDSEQMGSRLIGFAIRFGILLVVAIPAVGVADVAFLAAQHVFELERFWCYVAAFNAGSVVLLTEAALLIYVAAPRYRKFDLSTAR